MGYYLVWLISLVSTLFYLHSISALTIVNIAIVIIVAAIIILTIAALTYGPDEDEKKLIYGEYSPLNGKIQAKKV